MPLRASACLKVTDSARAPSTDKCILSLKESGSVFLLPFLQNALYDFKKKIFNCSLLFLSKKLKELILSLISSLSYLGRRDETKIFKSGLIEYRILNKLQNLSNKISNESTEMLFVPTKIMIDL